MTSKTAKSRSTKRGKRLVVFVVYPDIVLLDLVGPLQVFSHALDAKTRDNGYECAVVSVGGDMTPTNTVVSIPTLSVSDMSKRDIHTLVVVGGNGAIPGMRDPALVNAVQDLSRHAVRICSVCSGALILGAAGLLDGRRAVTHWDDCTMLAEEFPKVRVELDPIFIKDGNTWTSAGITAGIDMALAIIAEDLGRHSAMEIARSMVAQMVRSGGQSQYSPALGRQLTDRAGRFEGLHAWIADNIASPLTVEKLAEQVGMSARNFARAYANTMGKTPAKAVEAMRIESAQDLLESTPKSLKEIAVACGFNDEDRMRRAFLRTLNVSPSEYRRSFQVL
ncbi:MAG: GlxA family transcriptional regulator [Pseudomonadota bacterium]